MSTGSTNDPTFLVRLQSGRLYEKYSNSRLALRAARLFHSPWVAAPCVVPSGTMIPPDIAIRRRTSHFWLNDFKKGFIERGVPMQPIQASMLSVCNRARKVQNAEQNLLN